MIEVLMRFSGRFVANAPTLYSDSRCLKATLSTAVLGWLLECPLGDIRVSVKGLKVALAGTPRQGFVPFRVRARIEIWTEKGAIERLLPELFLFSFEMSCLVRERCSFCIYDSGFKEGELRLDRSWLRRLRCWRSEENRRTAE